MGKNKKTFEQLIGSEFRKEVKKVLEESSVNQSSVNEKRHNRWWYKRKRQSSFGELSIVTESFINFLVQSEFSNDLKKEVFIDYNGGNGVLCLYLNKLGYNTYFWDMDDKEGRNLLSYFGLKDKIIDERSDIFDGNPPFTVALACDCSLNDNLGIPLTRIKSLKYMFLDTYGRSGGATWCRPTDTSGFSIIERGTISSPHPLPFFLYKKNVL